VRVIKAEDRFNELPEKRKKAILKRADELYAEITKGVSTKFSRPKVAAPRGSKAPKPSPK
jgi:hypothetical protein